MILEQYGPVSQPEESSCWKNWQHHVPTLLMTVKSQTQEKHEQILTEETPTTAFLTAIVYFCHQSLGVIVCRPKICLNIFAGCFTHGVKTPWMWCLNHQEFIFISSCFPSSQVPSLSSPPNYFELVFITLPLGSACSFLHWEVELQAEDWRWWVMTHRSRPGTDLKMKNSGHTVLKSLKLRFRTWVCWFEDAF